MKHLLSLLKSRDWHGLFVAPSDNLLVQLFRYAFVGGIAFVVDAGSLWGMTAAGLNEYLATAIAFLLGLITNFVLSKRLVFSKENARVGGVLEFIAYGLIGIVGLGLTELLVFLGFDLLHLHILLVKTVAAALVLIWNFAARKLLLYTHKE